MSISKMTKNKKKSTNAKSLKRQCFYEDLKINIKLEVDLICYLKYI